MADATYTVTKERIRCLSDMLFEPTQYVQRCVEKVAFMPSGGHQWTRTLQIRIPSDAAPWGSSWRIIGLGLYARRRFPDFEVVDAHGARLDLLTREQHGQALTGEALTRLFDELPGEKPRASEIQGTYDELHKALYTFFTTAGDISGAARLKLVGDMAYCYTNILAQDWISASEKERLLKVFATWLRQKLDVTRYLCWVKAEPGEVVNLLVTYTAVDTRRRLGRGTLAERLSALWEGLAEPRERRWKVWADWYRQFGLAPLNYEFNVPSREHTGSYYFMLEPPAGVDVTYLDWESGNNLETNELDCALPSAHVHNDGSGTTERGGVIRAYLHCSARDHKLIVGTALLNWAFAILIAVDQVPGKVGTPAQSLLLAAPSILVAYIARQQQHYFSDAMRRQRGILWWYLGISVAFLVTITFGEHGGHFGSEGLNPFSSVMTWLWGIASACIAAWYLPLGNSYERITESQAKQRIHKVREREASHEPRSSPRAVSWLTVGVEQLKTSLPILRGRVDRIRKRRTDEPPPAWKVYERVIRRYSTIMAWLITGAGVAMLVALILIWILPSDARHHRQHPAASSAHQGTLTTTTWPSQACAGCNVELRFVPAK